MLAGLAGDRCRHELSTVAFGVVGPRAGLSPQAGFATELRGHIWGLHLLAPEDRFNGNHITIAEHIARRSLLILRAIQRSPRQPLPAGLDTCLLHRVAAVSGVRAPTFDSFGMESQQAEGFIMKHSRLARVEQEQLRK